MWFYKTKYRLFSFFQLKLFTVLCWASSPILPPALFESFVQHLTHCPGWLSQTWKSKAEMPPLMPDTWCRFGKDCATGTALPLHQSQKVPEVFPFLSKAVFVSALLCHPDIQPLSVGPCVGIRVRVCWNRMPIIPLINAILTCSDICQALKDFSGIKISF